MAVQAGTAYIDFEGRYGKLAKQTDQAMSSIATSASRTLGRGLVKATDTLATGFTAAATASGVMLGSLVKTGVAYNELNQRANAAFKTVLGSQKAAAGMMADITEFARSSPFPRQAFIKAAQQMTAFGVEGKKVIPILDSIQNAVAASGGGAQELSDVAFVISQISAAGKISGQDLIQLGQRGINAAELIGQAMGKTGPQIKEMISANAISADDAIDALTKSMSVKFAGAAASVKQTWTGATDRVKGALRDMGAAIVEPFITSTGGGMAVQWANDFADALRGVEALVKPIVDQLIKRLAPVLQQIDPMFKAITASIKAIDPATFGAIFDSLQSLAPLLSALGGGLLALGGKNIAGMLGPFGALLPKLNPVLTMLVTFVATSKEARPVLEQIVGVVMELFKALSPLIEAVMKALQPLIDTILVMGGKVLVQLGTSLAGVFQLLLPPLEKVVDALGKGLMQVFLALAPVLPRLAAAIGNLAVALADAIVPIIEALLPVLPVLVDLFIQLTPVILIASKALVAIVNAIPPGVLTGIIAGIIALEVAFVALDAVLFLIANPILGIVVAVAALGAGLYLLYKNVQPVHDAVDAMWQGLQTLGKALWGVLGPLVKAMAGFYLAIFRYMIEPIRTVVDVIIKLVHGDWQGALMELVTLPLRMLKLLGGIYGQLGRILVRLGQLLWKGLVALVTKVLPALGRLSLAVLKWAATDLVPAVVRAMGQAAAALWGWVVDAVPKLLGALGRFLAAIGSWALGMVPKLLALFAQWVPAILGWIVRAHIEIPLKLIEIAFAIQNWIWTTAAKLAVWMATKALPAIIGWVTDAAKALPGKLAAIATGIWNWITTTAPALASKVGALASAFLGWAGRVLRELPGKLADIAAKVWEWVSGLPKKITDAVPKIVDAAKGIGGAIMDGIVAGIKAAGKAVGGIAKAIWDGVWGFIKKNVFKPLADFEVGILGWKGKPFKSILSAAGIKGLAGGGMIGRPVLALVGEAGPELVLPLTDPSRAAELLSQYAPALLTRMQAGGATGPADAGATPADTSSATDWAVAIMAVLNKLAADIDAWAKLVTYRLALWASVQVPAATVPALGVWRQRVVAIFTLLTAQVVNILRSLSAQMVAIFSDTTATVSATLSAGARTWTTIATRAGQSIVDGLVGKLNTGTGRITQVVASYTKALVNGINPILTAIGEKTIRLGKGGVVVAYARGGVENHVAQIAGPGAVRMWAEPETGGEAYIPLGAGNRQRSKAITEEVVRRFGGMVRWFRDGGVTGDTHGLNSAFLQRVSQWSAAVGEPFHITSGYRDIGQQKVLYAKYLSGAGNLAAKPGSSMHNFGLAIDGPHWGGRNPGAFGLVYRVGGEPWHVEPLEARQWAGKMPATGWGDTPGIGFASLPAPPPIGHTGLLWDSADKTMKYVYARSMAWAANALASAAMGAPDVSGGALSAGSNVEIGRTMAAARGWTGAVFDALNKLWTRESGWRVNADNPSSSAFGIPQALPGTKMASAGADWRTNPVTQIAWGLGYIAERYGNPLRAWAHSQSTGWYRHGGLVFAHRNSFDNGGVLRPGMNLVSNETGRPEPVAPVRAGGGPAVAIGQAHFHEGIDYDAFLRKTAFLMRSGRM